MTSSFENAIGSSREDRDAMTMHNLHQHESYLRSALEQEKKPVGFLLGAGAPMSMRKGGKPLVPGLEDLTDLIVKEVPQPLSLALSALIEHLPTEQRRNLEQLLNYIRAMKSLPGDADIRGVSIADLNALDSAITKSIRKHVDAELPEGDSPYVSLAVWVAAVRRLAPAQVFTTNYDMLIEQAFERQRIAYFDGFMGSRHPTFNLEAIEEDELPNRWTLLWKLHGSINWSQEPDGEVVRKAPDPGDESSALVYPSHLKYDQSRRLPYLAMMDRLKAFMRKPGAILVTCGYSFRDQHINEILEQSLRANPTSTVQGLLFGSLDLYQEAVGMAESTANLILMGSTEGVIGTTRGRWASSIEDGDAAVQVSSDLGDFAKLGKFLRLLTGESRTKGIPDAQ